MIPILWAEISIFFGTHCICPNIFSLISCLWLCTCGCIISGVFLLYWWKVTTFSPPAPLSFSLFFPHAQSTPLSLSPSFFPFLSLPAGRLGPLCSEDGCFSAYSSLSDSQYGSPPRGWSEGMNEYGHTLYVSDYTNEKVPQLLPLSLGLGSAWQVVGILAFLMGRPTTNAHFFCLWLSFFCVYTNSG